MGQVTGRVCPSLAADATSSSKSTVPSALQNQQENPVAAPYWHEPFRVIFARLDKDQSGSVNRGEFIEALNNDPQVRSFLNMPEVDYDHESFKSFAEVFRAADSGVDNRLTWTEFLHFFGRIRPLSVAEYPNLPQKKLAIFLRVFKRLDQKTQDGAVDEHEFTDALRHDPEVQKFMDDIIPNGCPADTWSYIFREMDNDGNALITFNEFLLFAARRQRGKDNKQLARLGKEQVEAEPEPEDAEALEEFDQPGSAPATPSIQKSKSAGSLQAEPDEEEAVGPGM